MFFTAQRSLDKYQFSYVETSLNRVFLVDNSAMYKTGPQMPVQDT